MLGVQRQQVGCHRLGQHAGHIESAAVHIHHLFLDGALVRGGTVDLREEGRVRALAGIAGPLDFLVCHFDRSILAQGDPDGILQGEERRRGGGVGHLGEGEHGKEERNY